MNYYISYKSPVGWLNITCCKTGLCEIDFANNPIDNIDEVHHILRQTMHQFDEYFSGDRIKFELPLNLTGSDFQKQVWSAIHTIPYGQTVSYQEIAKKIKNPKAVRAVGVATGKNPLPIIIPCHRVIGSAGQMTGYAGGLWRKEFLLKLEGVLLV